MIEGFRPAGAGVLEVAPGGAEIQFSDLRDTRIGRGEVTDVALYGCVVDGTTTGAARLRATGCFGGLLESTGEIALASSHLTARAPAGEQRATWPEAVAAAAEQLVDGNNTERTHAARRLGELGDPEVVPLLGFSLTDPEWDVRRNALEAMGRLGAQSPELVRWMARRLGDEAPLVRATAWDVLKDRDGVIEAALDELTEPYPTVEAARAVTSLLVLAVADEVRARLEDEPLDGVTNHPDTDVRVQGTRLIAALDDPVRLTELETALEDAEASVRLAAVDAASRVTTPPAAKTLLPLLADEDDDVRVAALSVLTKLPDSDPDDLERARFNSSPRVRELAADLLGTADP
jgi:HEAT repeat protein